MKLLAKIKTISSMYYVPYENIISINAVAGVVSIRTHYGTNGYYKPGKDTYTDVTEVTFIEVEGESKIKMGA